MKKIMLLLCGLLLVLLAGCGARAAIPKGVSAPMRLPDGAKDAVWSKIDPESNTEKDASIDEVKFAYGDDDYSFVYRAKATQELENISGMEIVFERDLGEDYADKIQKGWAIIKMDEEVGEGVCIWYNKGYSFSLFMKHDATAKILMEMSSMLDKRVDWWFGDLQVRPNPTKP